MLRWFVQMSIHVRVLVGTKCTLPLTKMKNVNSCTPSHNDLIQVGGVTSTE